MRIECFERAKSTFINTNINITTEGHHYVGAAIGNRHFCDDMFTKKVNDWTNKLRRPLFVRSQQQDAYSAIINSVFSGGHMRLNTMNLC